MSAVTSTPPLGQKATSHLRRLVSEAQKRITQRALNATGARMRLNTLKLLFKADEAFDWESKKFFEKSRKLITETAEFEFYQDCDKQKRDFEQELNDFISKRMYNTE